MQGDSRQISPRRAAASFASDTVAARLVADEAGQETAAFSQLLLRTDVPGNPRGKRRAEDMLHPGPCLLKQRLQLFVVLVRLERPNHVKAILHKLNKQLLLLPQKLLLVLRQMLERLAGQFIADQQIVLSCCACRRRHVSAAQMLQSDRIEHGHRIGDFKVIAWVAFGEVCQILCQRRRQIEKETGTGPRCVQDELHQRQGERVVSVQSKTEQ